MVKHVVADAFEFFVSALFSLLFILLSPSASAFTLARANFDGGWAGSSLGFYYNSANCPASVGEALSAALKIWSNVPTARLKLKLAGASTATPAQLIGGSAEGSPVIVCDPNFSTTSAGADEDAVAGYGFFNPSGKHIAYGGIVLNAEAGGLANVNNLTQTELEVLLAHEMGHVLGIGHSEYSPALMYYDISAKSALNLAQDDIDAMTYLYPRDEFSDGIYGCGRVGATTPPPVTLGLAFFSMLLPLLLLLSFRKRVPGTFFPDTDGI